MSEHASFRILILDFSHITGVDYSASEAFLKLKRVVLSLKIHLLLCGIEGAGLYTIQNCGLLDKDDGEVDLEGDNRNDRWIHNFSHMDDALEWSENMLLEAYYAKLETIDNIEIPKSSPERSVPVRPLLLSQASPRRKQLAIAASQALRSPLMIGASETSPFGPLV